jgi:hypothetical protein
MMKQLLIKSNLLIDEVRPIMAIGPHQSNKRHAGSWTMCDVAIEHAHSLQNLMSIGNFTSAIALT